MPSSIRQLALLALIKEQCLDQRPFFCGKQESAVCSLSTSSLSEHHALHAFLLIGANCRAFSSTSRSKESSRLGMICTHLAVLSVEPNRSRFQIVLKIAHFPVALHIGPVHFIRDLDKLAANPYSFLSASTLFYPPISLNCEKFRLAGRSPTT
ncbi:MAG: hypothetical protein ACLR8M_13015 [Oscillospiraceae bacterium]